MNGAEWIKLVEIYVEAINEGAVPNIQSAWTYICKQGAEESLEQVRDSFEQELGSFAMHLPMNQEDLESFLHDQLQAASEDLQSKVKGEPEILAEV